MKKIKGYIVIIIEILFEHLTLLSTIIASVYILIDSQIREYSMSILLLWIISLLGLIATATASEKYFKLNKIQKGVESIQENINNSSFSLDEVFFTRKDLLTLEERMQNVKSIFLLGGSLARLADEYYALFEEKLKENCRIEIIMVRPFTASAELLCKNVVYETENKNLYNKKIEESLERFFVLKERFPQLIKIKLMENVPPFGIFATNLEMNDANIQIELYSYAVPARERRLFNVSSRDEKIFSFFINQIGTARLKSEEVEKDSYEFHT